MVQRGGDVVMRMLPDVGRETIDPLIELFVEQGSVVNTDEYGIYSHLSASGYTHKTVCHSHEEYARDDDGDGSREVHVNTIEGIWSLLCLWLSVHRGISQEKLPSYIAFFQFVHNSRKRGEALFQTLLDLLLA